MTYNAALDGLRALAILAVFVFHAHPSSLKGGFVGVDVFFVLSGFLITGNILQELERSTFGFKEFYTRRLQRLVPNILATFGATMVLWWLCFPPTVAALTAEHSLWAVFNGSNFFILNRLGGYWGDAAAFAPLLHTWSLAIEEQFYLLFPALVVLLWRTRRERLAWVFGGLTILSFLAGLYGTTRHPDATFYLMPTRVWELLMGAALAAGGAPGPETSRAQARWGWVGLILVLLGVFTIREGQGFPGWVAAVPTLGTLLMIQAVRGGAGPLVRLLSLPFFVEVGKRSYSLYLWHWPLIVLGRALAQLQGWPESLGTLGGAALSVPAAWAAYRWVEQPLRKRGPGRRRRLLTIGGGLLGVTALALVLAHPRPLPEAFAPTEFRGLGFSAGKVVSNAEAGRSTRFRDVSFPLQGARPDDAWRSGGVIRPAGASQPRVVVLGSSHALMYGQVLEDLCLQAGKPVAFLCVDGTPAFLEATQNASFPSRAEAQAFDEARLAWIRSWHPEAVVVVDRWDRYAGHPGRLRQRLEALLTALEPHTDKVVLVGQVPVLRVGEQLNLREFATWRMARSGAPPTCFPDLAEADRQILHGVIRTTVASRPKVRFLEVEGLFRMPDGSVRWREGNQVLFADDDHLSEAGARKVMPLLGAGLGLVAGKRAGDT